LAKEITNEELFIVRKMIDGDIDSSKYFFDRYYDDLCNFVHVYLHDQYAGKYSCLANMKNSATKKKLN